MLFIIYHYQVYVRTGQDGWFKRINTSTKTAERRSVLNDSSLSGLDDGEAMDKIHAAAINTALKKTKASIVMPNASCLMFRVYIDQNAIYVYSFYPLVGFQTTVVVTTIILRCHMCFAQAHEQRSLGVPSSCSRDIPGPPCCRVN